jgi:hypothetical protein
VAKSKPKKLFIEPRETGFAVLRPNAQRASFIEPTQKAAERRAKRMDPEAGIEVSRVRRTRKGVRGQWRSGDKI